jgi:crotonobetainyl-CoA:carnitine CoA-transferase CaiB-like acyl-CoA transferase
MVSALRMVEPPRNETLAEWTLGSHKGKAGVATRKHTAEQALRALETAEVPAGPIYSAKDMLKDPQYRERRVYEEVALPSGKRVKLPTVAPKLEHTPGALRWIGPPLGAHNIDVYQRWLGIPAHELDRLSSEGVI